MQHRVTRVSLTAAGAALALSVLASGGAMAQQAPTYQLDAIPSAQRTAMQRCVSNVLLRLRRAKASYREVSPAVGKDCDAQLRAVLAAAIQAGQAASCTVESCLEIARGRAGDTATLDYQRQNLAR